MFRGFAFALFFASTLAIVLPTALAQPDFRRGDVDGDGVAGTISDVNSLNRGLLPPPGSPIVNFCESTADVNDDGVVNIQDSILLLDTVVRSVTVPPPGPLTCGPDPTPPTLPCNFYSCAPTPLPLLPSATLRLESTFGEVGDLVIVRLFIDATGPDVDLPAAFSASIEHNPSIASIVAIDFHDPDLDFDHSTIEPGRCSLLAIDILGSALPNFIATITYELIAPGTTALTFGDLPLRTEVGTREGFGGIPLTVEGEIGVLEFLRGDANLDSLVDIADAISILGALFSGDPPPPCADAADMNDDGAVDLGDAISSLNYVFGSASAPPQPFPFCGLDPTPDTLRCAETICP